jgi:hypothetical protein
MRPVKHSLLGTGELRAHDIRLLLSRFFGFRHEQQLDLFSKSDRSTVAPAAVRNTGGLFDAGPPQHIQAMLGLGQRGRPHLVQRAILVACVGWIPLLILSVIQSILIRNGSFASFITDYGAIGRSLVAAPVLVMAELAAAPRLSAIAAHFRDAGLIGPGDMAGFHDAVASTMRLRDSVQLEIAIYVIAFATTAILALAVPLQFYPLWHLAGDGHARTLSAAGWWDALISAPLLVLLILGWLWRLMLWTRFLLLMSRLDLRLISAHPDRAAGLGFTGTALQPLAVVAFALSAIVAGTVANRVLHDNLSILDFRYIVPVFAGLMVVLFTAPLAVFANSLLEARNHGIFQYGFLARSLGRQMEARWLNHAATPETLDANDFSATTDLYAIVANVYAAGLIPVSLRGLIAVAVAALLPFVPVVLASVSPDVIFQKLTGMLL